MPLTLHDWFCMKGERSSFMPRIPDDAHLIFCHDDVIRTQILSSIEKRFATRKPVKMLLWGDWGVGKTHLTHHISWWFTQNMTDFPAYPVFVEIGDLTKKSRFDEIVRRFLDRMGLSLLVQLVHDYRGLESNVQNGLIAAGVSAKVSQAFAKFLISSPGQTPVPLVGQTFEYLKGGKASFNIDVGFGAPLQESDEFYHVLLALGEMYRRVHKHQIVFVADEAARLERIEADEDTLKHWVNTNKLIFDDQNNVFGFIYTVSGKQQRGLPQVIYDPQILNRLGKSNICELNTLTTDDVETYLSKLINEFVDRPEVEDLVKSGEIDAGKFSWDNYPFIAEAKSHFVDYFNRSQENSKPRDISLALDDLAFIAGKQKKRLIDRECLTLNDM